MKFINLLSYPLLLLILLFSSFTLFGQWYEQTSEPLEYQMNDIFFIDDQHGWIAGSQGNFLITTDGGNTWDENSVSIGGSVINLLATCFINQDTGLVSGANGIILRTKDGGFNWQIVKEPDGFGLSKLFYFDDRIYAGGPDRILRKILPAGDWELIDLGTQFEYDLTDMFFIDNQTGWTSIWVIQGWGSMYAEIFKTTDGFDTWESATFEWMSTGFKLFFLNENDGWCSGHWDEDPTGIYKTSNGGNSWSLSFEVYGHALFFTSMQKGWMAGQGIYAFSGGNWIIQQQSGDYLFKDIDFTDEENGWAIANDQQMGNFQSKIYHTENGGFISTGISTSKLADQIITIYPNPVKDQIHVEGIPSVISEIDYLIIPLSGNGNKTAGKLIPIHMKDICINATGLDPGIYLLIFTGPSHTFSRKFIKL